MPRTPAERDAVDPAVWQPPEMRAALAARDIATVYRRLQRVGVSQRRIAALTGQSQSEISEILSGRKVVSYDVLARIAIGLGVPCGWMGLAYDDARLSGPQHPAGGPENGYRGEVKRREVLAAGVAAATTVLAAPGSGPGGADAARPMSDVTARLGSLLLGVAPSARTAPRALASISGDIKRAWRLRQQCDYEAVGQLTVSLICDLDQAVPTGDDEQQQLLQLKVHTYHAAAMLLKRLGDSALALQAADRALRAARTLGDPLLGAKASLGLAQVCLAAGRLAETRSIALNAASAVEPGQMETARSMSQWGALLLTAAQAAARDRDEPAAWELVGEARTAARLLGTDYADMYSIFGPTNVAIHGVEVAVGLGDGRGAVRRGQAVNAEALPDTLVERRAQFLVDLAAAHLLERDHRECLGTLLRAEQSAPQFVRLNGQAHTMVRHLLHRTPGAAPQLRQLAKRVGADA